MRSQILQVKIEKALSDGYIVHTTTDQYWLSRNPGNKKGIKRIGFKLGVDYAYQHTVVNVFAYKLVKK